MMQGGPQMHTIAAKAVNFKEAATPEYAQYAKDVIANSRQLAASLLEVGIRPTTVVPVPSKRWTAADSLALPPPNTVAAPFMSAPAVSCTAALSEPATVVVPVVVSTRSTWPIVCLAPSNPPSTSSAPPSATSASRADGRGSRHGAVTTVACGGRGVVVVAAGRDVEVEVAGTRADGEDPPPHAASTSASPAPMVRAPKDGSRCTPRFSRPDRVVTMRAGTADGWRPRAGQLVGTESWCFITLPVAFRGSSSTKNSCRGRL